MQLQSWRQSFDPISELAVRIGVERVRFTPSIPATFRHTPNDTTKSHPVNEYETLSLRYGIARKV